MTKLKFIPADWVQTDTYNVHFLRWNTHEGASVLMKNNQQIESPPCSFIAISGDQPQIIGIRRDDILKLCNTIEEAERFIKYKF